MEYTNLFNLPQSIETALKADWYFQPGKMGVTTLISPPRIYQLRKRYDDQVVEDVSDRIWMLLGSAVHGVLERVDVDESLSEERLGIDINGWKITGQADLWEEPGIVSDYKVTSVWSGMFGLKPEWSSQLNIYSFFYRNYGFKVREARIIAIYRDWQKSKAKASMDYPQIPIGVIPVPLWDDDEVLDFMKERVTLHQKAESLDDDDLPICSPAERWDRPTTYAVKKKGGKRALRVLNSMEEAQQWMDANGKGDSIETRIGESIRCENYCNVKNWCSYYQDKIKGE